MLYFFFTSYDHFKFWLKKKSGGGSLMGFRVLLTYTQTHMTYIFSNIC